MGFDIQRFPDGVDDELTCMCLFSIRDITSFISSTNIFILLGVICGGGLENPLQAPQCEHAFCQVKRALFCIKSHTKQSMFR